MNVQLDADEQATCDELNGIGRMYQSIYGLVIAERLVKSLHAYLPEHWRDTAERAFDHGWQILEMDGETQTEFQRCCTKLRGEEIGLQANPAVAHVMRVVDRALLLVAESETVNDLIIEIHHLLAVLQSTAKQQAVITDAVENEKAYYASLCKIATNLGGEHLEIKREDVMAQLAPPPTTLFG